MPPARSSPRRRKRARKAAAPCPPDDSPLTPSGVKVGEGPGNLRGRADWFRKRSGS